MLLPRADELPGKSPSCRSMCYQDTMGKLLLPVVRSEGDVSDRQWFDNARLTIDVTKMVTGLADNGVYRNGEDWY